MASSDDRELGEDARSEGFGWFDFFWRSVRQKSGGVRVVYYLHSDLAPVYLLLKFAKKDRANLSAAQVKVLASLVRVLKSKIEGRR